MANLRLRINELPEELSPAPIDNIAIDGPSTRRTTLQRAADAVRPYSTEAQAREGLNTVTTMTPQRVNQAIETLGGQRFATSQQGNKADSAVQPSRTISAGAGLTGGGTLAANREIALNSASIASFALANSAVQPARQVIAGGGLAGGGSLAADRTISLSAATQASLSKAESAIQAPGGATGQVLVKKSAANNDVDWQTIEAATAVSYAPQSLTDPQKQQARQNIGALDDASIAGSPTKDTPIDADGVVLVDSADIGKTKRVLWSRVKAVLQAFFDNRYLRLTSGTLSGALNILSNTAAFSPLLNLRNSGAGDIAISMVGGGRDFATSVHIEIGQRANGDLFLWNGAGVQVTLDKNGTLLATGWIVSDQNIRASGGAVYAGTGDKRFTGDCYDPTVWRDRWGQGDGWAWSGINGQIEARSYARTRDYLLSEQIPVGGYVLARFMGNPDTNNPQSVGGGDLAWSNVDCLEGGRINYGTWVPSGVHYTNGPFSSPANRTTLYKRIG